MRKIQLILALFLASQLAIAQLQLANPINVKLYNNKRLEKKLKRNKATFEKYIPFKLEGGMIMLPAMINGITNTFILDTGASNLLLNKKVSIDSADTKGADINGSLRLQETLVKDFQVGNLNLKDVEGYKLDLSQIEEIKEVKIGGMIGQDLIKNHELILDYKRQRLMFLDPAKSLQPTDLKPTSFIPFKMQKHFIVVTAKVGGKRLRFGVDTGAEVNLLSEKTFKKMNVENLVDVDSVQVAGVKNAARNSCQVKIANTVLKSKNYKDMSYVVMNMDAMNKVYGVKLDGILGYPFLASQTFSINYLDQKMYIWEDVHQGEGQEVLVENKKDN